MGNEERFHYNKGCILCRSRQEEQVAKTKAINDLDKIIAKEDRNVGRNTSVETSEKTGNILDMLERSMKK